MSLKKMLGIISVIIIVVFSMMLTTSYAWYAFDNASTTFSGVTNNDDVVISYQHGEYINTNIAIPITSDQIEQYSDKNNFNIKVKNSAFDNELAVTVSLIEISIDRALQDANFKIDLYHQGGLVGTLVGNQTSGLTSYSFNTVVLDNDVTNNFEVRVYLLDNGANQTGLMNKTFSAKLQIDVVSRLKINETDYSGADILVSSITIDGEASNSLPTAGYYDMEATCTKGSNLTWEPLSKTITYAAGSYINDSCSLAFTYSTDYPLLKDMPVGSYVKYVGNNGCDGKACEGYNANYKSDTNMGYCGGDGVKFHVNGWRIAYIEDNDDEDATNDNAVIVSAGAPECMCTDADGNASDSSCSTYLSSEDIDKHFENLDAISLKYCNSKYVKGGVCNSTTAWAMDASDFQVITERELSIDSCYNEGSSVLCGWTNDLIDNGSFYWFGDIYDNFELINWHPSNRFVTKVASDNILGVRPVINLDSSVIVTGGKGTYKDPYIISIS